MPESVAAGQIVAGKYRVDRVIGQGGMGLVVAATHLALGQRVALKFLIGGGPAARVHEQRFLREARAASMLRSQHVGKVLDVGTLEDGAPYIVMELLDGKDLAGVLRERRRLPVTEAIAYILQVCEAVAEAHAAGIVHRDIKPGNLFLTRGADGSPCVKVVDFGIAKVGGEQQLALTGTVQALGSPLYMSPEQMQSTRDVDGRADLWSLGVVLYEMLGGVTPFAAPTVPAVVLRVFSEPPTPLAEHRPDVPQALAAAIVRCLDKDPNRRWPGVSAFAAALAPFAAGGAPAMRVAQAPPPAPPSAQPSAPAVALRPPPPVPAVAATQTDVPNHPAATLAATSTTLAPTPAPPSRAPALLAVAALAVGLPLAVFFGLRGRERGPAQAAVPSVAPTPPEAAASASASVPTAAPPSAETAAAATASALANPSPTATPAGNPQPAKPRLPSAPAPERKGPWEGPRQ